MRAKIYFPCGYCTGCWDCIVGILINFDVLFVFARVECWRVCVLRGRLITVYAAVWHADDKYICQ